jgi:hypothetical protein
MSGSSVPSLAAGLVVVALGAIPAVWLLTAPAEEAPTPTTSQTVVTTTAPVTAPAPAVAGLSDAIGTVLGDAGAAETVQIESLANDLPEPVIRVLIEHGAVLTVAEEPIEEQP